MSIRILTLATAAATTLEGSIFRRQVRLVKVRKATHQTRRGFPMRLIAFILSSVIALASIPASASAAEQHIQSDKRQHHLLGCEETSMAQPEHNTRQSNRREL
jgi:hypothetical protein